MRKPNKAWWQHSPPPAILEELEHWLRVLLIVIAGLLLYAALKAQFTRAARLPTETLAAVASSTPLHGTEVHAVLAPGMPPRRPS